MRGHHSGSGTLQAHICTICLCSVVLSAPEEAAGAGDAWWR